jgi:outer membrane protein TolC
MKRFLILLILFQMNLNIPQSFSEEKAANQVLTLEECIQLAIKNRPELEMASLDILNAEYQIKEATSYYYPRLNLNTGYTRFNRPAEFDTDVDITAIKKPIQPILSTYGIDIPSVIPQKVEVGKRDWFSVSLDLNQPIYTFGRIEEGVKQARIGHSMTLNQKEKKRREIIFEVKKGYYQFLLTKEIHQLMKEAETRANVVARMVKIAYETFIPEKEEKGTTRLDYLKAKNFNSEVKARLSEANKNLKLAELALKMAIGVNTDYALSLAEIPLESMPVALFNSGEAKEKVKEKNVDLKNFDLGVQLLDARRRAAKKEYLPKIGLQGQYIGPEDRYGTEHFWYLGIGITMSLFDGFSTKAKVGQAEVQFQKTKGQKILLEKALYVQIDQLNTTLMELRERIEILQTAIKEAQERTQLAADGYAVGITEYDELLLAQRTELEMKSAYLQGLYLYHVTKTEIEFISGDI